MKDEIIDDIEEKKQNCNNDLLYGTANALSAIRDDEINDNVLSFVDQFSNGDYLNMRQNDQKLTLSIGEQRENDQIQAKRSFSIRQNVHQTQKCSIRSQSNVSQLFDLQSSCIAFRQKKTKKIKRIKNLFISKPNQSLIPEILNTCQRYNGLSSSDLPLLTIKQYQSMKNLQNNEVTDNVNEFKKKRNGKSIQSLMQKFIKKVSGYHYSKNYKQQKENYEKKILIQTQKPMDLESFKQKLRKYSPKINKKLNFLTILKDDDERKFVELFYRNCIRQVYVLMYKTELRRCKKQEIKSQDVSEQSNIQFKFCKKSKNELDPCLDAEGNKQLMTIFDKIFEKSIQEFRKQMDKLERTLTFEPQDIKSMLIKNLQF